jgi:hypothetical protein
MIVCVALYKKADAGEGAQGRGNPVGVRPGSPWGESFTQGAGGIGPRGAPGGQEARRQ